MKRKVRGKVLKKIKREKAVCKCFLCGGTSHLEQHHIIPKEIGGSRLKCNKVYICNKCHPQIHKLLTPAIQHLLAYIYALQEELKKYVKIKEPHKVGFIWKNSKHVGKEIKK